MSLDVITSAAGAQSQSGSALQNNWRNVLGAAANALGLSPSSVSSQLQAGASLSSIAQSQGVSEQALTGAIAAALSPSTQASATAAERQQIATSIANRAGGPHQNGKGQNALDDPAATSGALDDPTAISSVDVLVVLTGAYSYTASAIPSGQAQSSAVNQLA